MGGSRVNLPFQPLRDFMVRQGLGLTDLFPQEVVVTATEDDYWRTAPPIDGQRVCRDAFPTYLNWERRLRAARQRGWIKVRYADEFCIELLGRHPSEIYGHEWFA